MPKSGTILPKGTIPREPVGNGSFHTHMCTHVSTHKCTCMYTHTYTQALTCTQRYAHIYVHMHTRVHTGTHMCTQTHTYTQCIVSLGATGNSRLKTPGHLNQGVIENLDKFERKEEEEWHKILEALQRGVSR